MFWLLFLPIADLLFDHAGFDAVASRRDDFFCDLIDEIVMPSSMAAFAWGAFGESAAENLQRVGERETIRIDLLFGRRLLHQDSNEIVSQQ